MPAPTRVDSPPAGRLAGLDTLRALAIVCVVVYHLNWRLPAAFAIAGRFGWMGVDLFFVLSGYLIGSQLLKAVQRGEGVGLREFYRRRAYRILPAYLVVLGLYRVWPGWWEDTGMSPLWEFLTFTENLFVDYAKNHAFSHVWSLCVEEHFYLLLPLIVLWLSRRPSARKTVAVLAGFVLLGIAARSYALHVLRAVGAGTDEYSVLYIERVYYPTWSRLDGLLAGVALALVRVFRPGWWQALVRRANGLLVAGAALVGVSIWMFYHRFGSDMGAAAASTVIGFPVLSLGLACWIPAAADARCWFARLRLPGARMLATLAFSLYLTHKEVGHVVHAWFPAATEEHRWRTVPIYAVGCLVVAAVLYFAVERPFLRLRERRDMQRSEPDIEAGVEHAL
jgi:peptidoglycan/LPS O-acetylase OafA/YrhL